jgi:cytochrome c peroxidase
MKSYAFMAAIVVWLVASCMMACRRQQEDAAPAESYALELPPHFPAPKYGFENNTVSPEGFELGRMLFYDPILSRDSSTSCSSCHQQFVAFAHSGHAKSHGIDNQFTLRNSPVLFNLAWQEEFFFDGGVNHIENISIAPITNPLEMDESLARVIYKLNRSERYREKFKRVFQKDTIDSQQMLRAMTQFIGTMVSADSKYDRHVTKTPSLSEEELEGLNLFTQKCGTCHEGPLFTDHSYRNNGLNATFINDTGREHITTLASDLGKFKVPTLRNIALSSPYMHDGSIKTLDQVLEHYRTGVVFSTTLDPLLDRGNGQYGIAMSDDEKQKIILFLHTLTDQTFITRSKFSDPFYP